MSRESPVTRWLRGTSPVLFSGYAILAAFTTYFCMYAFRTPFAAGTFDGPVSEALPDFKLKSLFIISQVIGYCLSKFMGIKVISEMSGSRRAVAILACIGVAEAALALFGLVPAPWNAACLFINGLPLGMVWGLVFGFLEGRKVSEALGAGLSASYIVASGAVKWVGRSLVDAGVSEYWMPFLTGLCFAPLLLLSVWMLARLPPPTAEDEALRVRREPMDAAARRGFVRAFAPGLGLLTLLYFFLTAYRSVRDNFAVEIWAALGYSGQPSILAKAEVPIAVAVMVVLGTLMAIRSNRKALTVVHGVMLAGTAGIGVSTLLFQAGILPPAAWMILVGLGLYIAYVPYGCVLFDRMLAALGVMGTAGFMIYVTDAFGYLGSVLVTLYKDFGHAELSWLSFFVGFSYFTSILCTVCFLGSMIYFGRASARAPAQVAEAAPVVVR